MSEEREVIVAKNEILGQVSLFHYETGPPYGHDIYDVVVDCTDVYSGWMIDVKLCKEDLKKRKPPGKIRLNEKRCLWFTIAEAKWLAHRLLQAVEYTETHDYGEIAEAKDERVQLSVVGDDD